MHEYADLAAFSDLVGAIYDCAIDPGRWPETLAMLRRALGFANASLSLTELPSGRVLLNVSSGIEPQWEERMPDYATDIIDMWGGPAVAVAFPLDRPAVLSRLNPTVLAEATNRYVRDWAYPQGLVDSMAILLARDATAADGSVHALHVLPLRHAGAVAGLVPDAAAAVFVASPHARPRRLGHAAATIFDLTPAEARVLDGIAAGRTPADVARALGVAPSTVRTHVLRLFRKTGVRRQAELVQLVAALTAPLTAEAPSTPAEARHRSGDRGEQAE